MGVDPEAGATPVLPARVLVLVLLDSGGWHTGSVGGEGRSCLAFSVEECVLKAAGDLEMTGVRDIRLGAGPLGEVLALGVLGPRVLPLLHWAFGVRQGWAIEGARGVLGVERVRRGC